MSILSIFKGNKLKASWRLLTANPSVIVWKLLISPVGILCGEERDTESKRASLFALDVRSGSVLWRNAVIDEAWWFNSERATEASIYIQKFRKPDMPEPKGIIALDIHNGSVRWEQPDVSMLFEYDAKVYAQREGFGRKEFFALDNTTGEVLEAYGSEKENILALQSMITDPDTHSIYSIAITPHDELFAAIANVLGDLLDVSELRGTIDFAQYGTYIIFSYHERILNDANAMLGNMLRNHLKVLDTDKGEIVYSDEPNAVTPYPVPENFFIHRGVLIYVKEKREVIGVPLSTQY
jgi:hypothetical protein